MSAAPWTRQFPPPGAAMAGAWRSLSAVPRPAAGPPVARAASYALGDALDRPATPPQPHATSPPPADDDGAPLAPGAALRFIEAFFAVVPPNSSALPRTTVLECHSDLPGDAWDPRWRAAFCHPLFTCFMHWIGARIVLEASGDPTNTAFSPAVLLGALVPRLERRFERLLREELARFWLDAAESRRIGANLHTPENLSLMWTLSAAVVFIDLQQARTDGAKAFLRQAVSLWRRLGVPGEDETEPPPQTLDDFLFRQQWLNCFNICCSADFWQAFNSKGTPAMDPAREFPTAPLHPALGALSAIPPPSQRPANGPVPPTLTAITPTFRYREFVGFLDPHREPPVPPETRAAILDWTITRMEEHGIGPFVCMLNAGLSRILRFTTWLRDEARLGMLEVLVAEDLLAKGAALDGSGFRLPEAVGMPRSRLEAVLRNPMLPEAVRQRAFLRDAVGAMEAAVPPAMAAALKASDFDAFSAAVSPDLDRGQQLQVISYVSQIWLTFMLLGSPEPFENWVGEDEDEEPLKEIPEPSSPQSLSSDSTSVSFADELLELWFTTSSFLEASRHAIVVSGNLRMILRSFQPRELGNNLFTLTACFSSVYACWFHLLVLRRFRSIVARASASDQAQALALHADIMEDVQACLNMLEGSGREQYQAVRRLLQSILDGDETRLSRADLQMLRTARQARFGCTHADVDEGEGHCYLCAMESAKRGEAGGGSGQGASDPLADMPVYDLLDLDSGTDDSDSDAGTTRSKPRPGRGSPELAFKKATVVRFSDEITVHETYSNDEYPARSMLAPDHPDDAEPEDGEATAEANPVLSMMLEQRGLKLR
ncbi:hypothetical protein DFJ74DRAFT_58225 [Hyaloraphidium curvatum]|nr:hypothetical protein DFJ74DRAFT_58225 [Hyaloraphidium curvatum]